jgi:hypothetical protein
VLIDEVDWQAVVTLENKELYIALVLILLVLQLYLLWRTRH